MTLKFPPDYPETFREFVTLMVPRLTQVLSDEVQASEVAFALVEDLRKAFIGCLLYFPRGTHKDAAERKAAILRDFNGHNYKELSVKYNLSNQYIYQIISAKKKGA
ncbi:MAG: Mor transcription activator family protein [Candidatus Competibacter sp.]|jgi:Mor family transcriptional regulator|nr:hypothetical protein [Nitrospira sp.]